MAAFNDEIVIDPISGEQLSPSHAIFIPCTDGIDDVMNYVKAVSNSVGSKNIRSAYKVENKVKIYLRFLKHVEELVSTGVCLKGKFTAVDYCEPPATEVLLKEIDTEVPNNLITNELQMLGSVVSKVTTLTLPSSDFEFSHIETNTRKVFVKFFALAHIPPVIKIMHNLKEYSVVLSAPTPFTPNNSANLNNMPPSTEHSSTNSLQNRIVNISDLNRRVNIPAGNERVLKRKVNPAIKIEGRRLRKKRRFATNLQKKNNSVALAKIKAKNEITKREQISNDNILLPHTENIEGVLTQVNSGNCTTAVDNTNEHILGGNENSKLQNLLSPNSRTYGSESRQYNLEGTSNEFDDFDSLDTKVGILNRLNEFSENAQLQLFLRNVKNQRNPLKVALSMLENKEIDGTIETLCDQLFQYLNYTEDIALRMRLNRLVERLSQGKKME